jgi:hypothetical protein
MSYPYGEFHEQSRVLNFRWNHLTLTWCLLVRKRSSFGANEFQFSLKTFNTMILQQYNGAIV